jgi:hypothetical protein
VEVSRQGLGLEGSAVAFDEFIKPVDDGEPLG